ncbi:TIGR00341 family protein [Microbulbifer agarilyticus]|uniref:TIGR00341 family protein n=1 Tax=Microbulbifer agarilyticus TaxID=260552 RepID=A0A1Q2M8D4_9GAMM|nr:TIGR00341 family protein [Microbulbifer agarilyticus]AQQ68993.1 TIGR00341 family protein [Microbulbifer agarilyticus]
MKLLAILTDPRDTDRVAAIAEARKAEEFRIEGPVQSGHQAMRLLTSDDKVQAFLDDLAPLVDGVAGARVLVIPVELSLPKPSDAQRKKEDTALAAREALYASAEKSARLDRDYVILVVLSTLVAAIGMLENNVAAVIGAMVIAPLLGPNMAFGLGTALADTALMRSALKTLVVGLSVAVGLSVVIGLIWPWGTLSNELLSRTYVGWDSVVLALASGAAAALSMTSGLSSVLVGVMVAVALLPPAATFGMMLGSGKWQLALGAGLLLAVNIVCVNLACKLVFLMKGIEPRTWWQKKSANKAMKIYIAVWVCTLLLLMAAIYLRDQFNLQ